MYQIKIAHHTNNYIKGMEYNFMILMTAVKIEVKTNNEDSKIILTTEKKFAIMFTCKIMTFCQMYESNSKNKFL